MNKCKREKISCFILVAFLIQFITSVAVPLYVNAADINHPDEVAIEYPDDVYYTFQGKWSDGSDFKSNSSPLSAVYEGSKVPVFCIEPGVEIDGPSSSGYEKNPLPSMPEKAKMVSALWQDAGTDTETRMIAQGMIWQEVNKLQIDKISEGVSQLPLDKKGIESKINQAIADYKKKPSFDNQAVNLVVGNSETLVDTNGAEITDFDRVVKNTANVNYKVNGNKIIVTANSDSKTNGELVLEKTKKAGTPVIYKKAGEQTVLAGAIDQTNKFTVKINVNKNGNLKIVKRDKESGSLVPGTVFVIDYHGTKPATEVTTGKDGTATITDIPHETKVTITEKSVPSPYVVDPTPMDAVIKAGETVEVTSRNLRAKGQIMVDKEGMESGLSLWNHNYSLAGNTFDIRKDSKDGNIVTSIVTDENGHAETSNNSSEALELGTYYVTESKSSNGFVNTFDPQKVELNYDNQTIQLISQSVKGKNQEVTGEATLEKTDKDTDKDFQGAANFSGAEYTLYHAEEGDEYKTGDPVKLTEGFHPTITKGVASNNPIEKDAISLVIDKEHQVGVSHLALGKYFWQETKAPLGYTKDLTKYAFEVAKKDDNVSNAIVSNVTSAKEQVVRFNLDFFKFTNSLGGSASTGYNGIEFKLTPLEGTSKITIGNETTKTGHNDQLGFDGYGKFENIPFGDYLLEEIEAPAGFDKIEPLEIHSRFEENKSDYGESNYIFTISEQGQKEPISELKVPYSNLTSEKFSVKLNRLMLYNLPKEKNSITSLATWSNGEKVLTNSSDTTLIDEVSYKMNEVKDDWFVVSKVVDVAATKGNQEKDSDSEPVVISESSSEQKNAEKQGIWKFEHKLEFSDVKDKDLVLFNYVYDSEEAYQNGDEPIAIDDNLDNQAQTVKVAVKNGVTIKTKAHLENGSNTFTHGDVVDMYDDVEISHDILDGSKESFETILVAIYPDGKTKEIWKSGLIDYEVNDQVFTKTVIANEVDTSQYPKDTIFSFKEINYDSAGEINGKHNEDLTQKDQSLYPEEKVVDSDKESSEPSNSSPKVSKTEQEEKKENPASETTSKESLPKLGDGPTSILLFIGFTLIFGVTAVYLWKHYDE